jgi:hypothetical protein
MQNAQGAWQKTYGAHKKAKLDADHAVQEKEKAYETYASLLRSSVRKVNALPNADNALRASLGLPSHAETRTKNGAPETRPVGRIVDEGSRRLSVHWVDEETPHTRKKPQGVDACELWLKVGDAPPVDESGCELVARDTASPYLYEFEAADVGKTAYFLLRWVNRQNDRGPFGAVVSARVSG